MSQDRELTVKVNSNGRVTIPARIRDYFELPDLDEDDVYLNLTIHGLDPVKHPDHPLADDGGDS